VTAGFTAITMRLPAQAGTSDVTLAGGATNVRISLPAGAGTAARLDLGGGAGYAAVGTRSVTGPGGGTVLTSPGWATAIRRYEINVPAGVASIKVASRPAPAAHGS
jgi:hypothetical protein